MKIVITGAAGYIGSRLCIHLAECGHQVIPVYYRNIPSILPWKNSNSQIILGDIRDQKTIHKISEVGPDALAHMISLDQNKSEDNPNFVGQVNTLPTWNLLEACTSTGLNMFIYFSTIHVYGMNLTGLIDENQKPAPFNSYGLSHYLSEEICNYYHRKTKTNCMNIRLSNSYGEPVFSNANCWRLIVNNLVRTAWIDKKIVLRSDGTAVRDFTHYSDICCGVTKLLATPKNKNINTYNFSSSISISLFNVALKVKDVYFNRYNQDIPIYINTNELLNDMISPRVESYRIINNRARGLSIDFNKTLYSGIDDLFTYFENE